MTQIQWFAFVILPCALAVLALAASRLFDRAHPIPGGAATSDGLASYAVSQALTYAFCNVVSRNLAIQENQVSGVQDIQTMTKIQRLLVSEADGDKSATEALNDIVGKGGMDAAYIESLRLLNRVRRQASAQGPQSESQSSSRTEDGNSKR